jgi:OmcA/MtrC family decaheme c-type cytochrome
MNKAKWIFLGLLSLCVLIIISACSTPPGPAGPAGPAGPQGPAGPAGKDGAPGVSYIPAAGPGLKATISAAKFPTDGKPVVTLTLTDAAGVPQKPDALDSVGFTVAQLVEDKVSGQYRYQSLLVHEVDGKPYKEDGETKQPALAKATQAYADNGGTWADQSNGVYTYTFKNSLSSPVDPSLTTVVGVYVSKDSRKYVANDVFTFVPAGGEPKNTRQVVSTDACQTCHNPLEAHGGLRRDVRLCVTCHTDQTTDPETGNTLDFQVLIHRLHDGSQLPSVVNGTPYQIVGYNQSVSNFSDITWPQDVRNCTTCHNSSAQSDYYKTQPNTAACTSCHDTTNPATGDNHPGGIQTDDKCAGCHAPDGKEFDTSVTGAHTIPLKSKEITGLKLEIVSVEGAVPGGSPTVKFKVTDSSGKVLDPTTLTSLSLTLAGPTNDYVNRWTESAVSSSSKTPSTVTEVGDGVYQYQFKAQIPKDATGTYAVGMEGYVMQTISESANPIRVAAFNPVAYAALDGGQPTPRRQVVDLQKCNACHQSLSAHGGIRQNPEYCVLCHNPMGTDEAQRPADAMPPTTINFPVLIHSVHNGANATQLFQIYGHGGTPVSFTDIVFPGDLSACQTCHLPGTYGLPLVKGKQPTTVTQAGKVVSTTLPDRSICTSCHDSQDALGHIELQTTSSGLETCAVCHGANSDFDVNTVHH